MAVQVVAPVRVAAELGAGDLAAPPAVKVGAAAAPATTDRVARVVTTTVRAGSTTTDRVARDVTTMVPGDEVPAGTTTDRAGSTTTAL